MHELSIAQNVIEIVQQNLPPAPHPPVRAVKMRVGEMAGVVIDSLEFCFSAIISDTPLEGARLEVERVPVVAHCRRCELHFEVEQYAFICPSCENIEIEVISGRELQVVEVELLDEKVEAI
ncbi:MAG: hydrogenase maturation nickel metallochaperone HypA [Acidobacteriia bacterium]|nr:hydrogenase maturation nickel metallochaperone HypA [Terriglobia bacterium]